MGISGSSDAPGSFALCESEASATKCFICAKAKRQQQQSAQSEWKSTLRYGVNILNKPHFSQKSESTSVDFFREIF
ncbi:hypothetical protein [Lysinibacillus sp. NPDC056232]|uniref:hypothetical protein n=1 Tax=Lysinibacillus sp. NPDC056232 TaxID=3345756 RepID=UPI0035DE4A14